MCILNKYRAYFTTPLKFILNSTAKCAWAFTRSFIVRHSTTTIERELLADSVLLSLLFKLTRKLIHLKIVL